ncbi:hypothetical protein PICMEDRAFT_25166, partial [Pichia membranifaciens NRRL Y-2026]
EAKVAWKPLNNCLVSLPSSFIYPIVNSTNLLVQQILIRITNSKTEKYIITTGWNGVTSSDAKTIEIDSQYAKLLNIHEGLMVNIELDLQFLKGNNKETLLASSVEIEPETTSDWELTELHAEAIEANFLSQVRCVSKDQLLLIRSNPTASGSSASGAISFRIKKIKTLADDVNLALVGNTTELHIIPKPHNHHPQKANHEQVSNGCRKKHSVSSKRTHQKSDSIIRRSIINHEGCDITVYNRGPKLSQFKNIEYVQICVIEGPGTPTRARKTSSKETGLGIPKDMFGRKIVAKYVDCFSVFDENDDNEELALRKSSVMLSPLLAISLGLENTCGEIVCLEPCNKKCIKLDLKQCELYIHKLTTTGDESNFVDQGETLKLKQEAKNEKMKQLEMKKQFSDIMKQILMGMYDQGTPLTNGMKVPIVENVLPEGGILEISNKTSNSLTADKKQKIKLGKYQLVPRSRIQKPFNSARKLEIYGQDKKMYLIKQSLYSGVPTFLYGKSGSGKTLICKIIQEEFAQKGYYVKYINFEQIGNVSNLFSKIFEECFWHSPSLIILDNLDKVLPKDVEHGDNSISLQLSEILISKAEKYCERNNITFLVTSVSRNSINKIIFQKHLVDEEIGLGAPNKTQLSEILEKMTSKRFPEYMDGTMLNYVSDIASELEGYLPLDLENILDRAFHHLITEQKDKFDYQDFISAIDGYTPTSLRGVKLQKATTSWSNIGGLLEVKKILLETLEWPTKYAPIFEKCTLRLRSGILLYGYPGCGKTMLASAISSQCGLNFISVKGPEILNKYIGASEQSVRELFERAQSAKPCILFFDEFDSIAPKRGHDSTGVTDRIVNQLLTQMDGAEGLEGVYVLAATSRPDLIDSALLRPGRLDKSVICDLPDYENRLDILKTIVKSNGFNLKDEQSLTGIANATNGYTGADLQAVVYNAYLKGVHERLESDASGNAENLEYKVIFGEKIENNMIRNFDLTRKKIETLMESHENLVLPFGKTRSQPVEENDSEKMGAKIYISLNHLQESLQETKKSISVKELEKLENIYAQFESSKRPSEMKDGEGSTNVGVRTTLM